MFDERKYKQRFPFRLACPSFIYPADYLPNVQRLGPSMDEIELLFLEGRCREALPTPALISELAEIGRTMPLGYNVHLPTDIALTASDRGEERLAAARLCQVLDLVRPLEASAHVLHLPWEGGDSGQGSGDRRQRSEIRDQMSDVRGQRSEDRDQRAEGRGWRAGNGCGAVKADEDREAFLDAGLRGLEELQKSGADLGGLVLENLEHYPVEWLEDVLEASGLGLCLDLGHLLLQGRDLWAVYERNQHRIRIMHLHGVDQNQGQSKDHLGLHYLSPDHLPVVQRILTSFQGVLCLEVFNVQDLEASLTVLEELLG